jgi:branched-chain amino acid transport system permease protein
MLDQILNGVFVGSIYALFAVGYTLVFGVLDILNLAHQAVFMLSAFVALALVADAHLPLWVALPISIVVGGIIGVVLERIAFRPLRGRSDSNISGLITSLAMATVFEAIALQIFGPDVSRFPFGTVSNEKALPYVILGLSVLLMVALTFLLAKTRLGRQIRAVAENPRAARVLGINVNRVIALSFFISSAMAGAAGVLFGLAFNSISPDVGRSVELKGLAVIILGGMGSVPGAVIAGFAIGLVEVFTVAYVGSSYRDAISFAVLFLVLVARPRGLLGQKAAREA